MSNDTVTDVYFLINEWKQGGGKGACRPKLWPCWSLPLITYASRGDGGGGGGQHQCIHILYTGLLKMLQYLNHSNPTHDNWHHF